jgi:hypothetical protein
VPEDRAGASRLTGTASTGFSGMSVPANRDTSVPANRDAPAQKTGTPLPKKPVLAVPENRDSKEYSFGGLGGSGGLGGGKPAPKGQKGGKTNKPKFEPIRPDAFPSRLKEMLAACEEEIFRFKNPATLPADLRRREFLQEKNAAWLENEAKEKPAAAAKLLKKAAALRQDSENYKWALSDDGREHLALWKNRAAEIKARLNGKIP